jgi:hypothetical protein
MRNHILLDRILQTICNPDVMWYRCEYFPNRIMPNLWPVAVWGLEIRDGWFSCLLLKLGFNCHIGVMGFFFRLSENQLKKSEIRRLSCRLKEIRKNCRVFKTQAEFEHWWNLERPLKPRYDATTNIWK